MEKANISIVMAVTIMGIGLRVKCREWANSTTLMATLNIKDNGKMITTKERERFMDLEEWTG